MKLLIVPGITQLKAASVENAARSLARRVAAEVLA